MQMSLEEGLAGHVRARNVDKAVRYGWIFRDVPPGQFRMVPKHSLFFDQTYQREVMNNRVLDIAREFSWFSFGVLSVAARREGSAETLYVVDGQHRLRAAQQLRTITAVPCLVFKLSDEQQEALAFLDINCGRRPPTFFERFRVMLILRDEGAVYLHDLLQGTGHQASKDSGPGRVACLNLMLRLVSHSREVITALWPMIAELTNGSAVHERVVDSLVYIERHMPVGDSLLDRRWRDRLKRLGADGILQAANRAAAFYTRGGHTVWAQGIVNELNKGLRTKLRLRALDGSDEGDEEVDS